MKNLIAGFVLFSLWGCYANERLEFALEFAGKNRPELEKVLAYYAGEPEKYRAAVFLIENMPRWYSYEGWALDSIHSILSEGYKKDYIPPAVFKEWSSFPFRSFPKVYDAHVITSGFLIRNIDLAFEVREKYSWNKELSFDDFCELILPYRLGDEPLSDWRSVYFTHYTHVLDSLYQGTDVINAANVLARVLKTEGFRWISGFNMPRSSAMFLYENRIGYCRESCDITLYALRACGIPVAFDYFVYSPEYQQSHTWNVVRDTTGQYIPLYFTSYFASRTMEDDGRKKGKVYRECFGVQPEKVPGIASSEDSPSLFKNRFIRDVSDNYFGVNPVEIPVESGKEKYLYLGIFSPSGWIPVDVSLIKKGKATFYSPEPDIIYQPLFIHGATSVPAGHPFLYTATGIHWFLPDKERTDSLYVTRKMPLMANYTEFLNDNVLGARLEGSMTPGFESPVLLYQITDTLTMAYNNYPSLSNHPFRYFRYSPPPGKRIELAELTLYRDAAAEIAVPLIPLDTGTEYEKQLNSVDGDILTFYYSSVRQHLVLDAGEPVRVASIDFYPRNDDNFIRPGDTYELFFQDGVEGWKSIGTQVAEEHFLNWIVPRNAVYWLRNLTRGREEQIFTIRNNRPLFVYDIGR